jgi:cytochrome P450
MLPVTDGDLMEFSNDPVACMRRLYRRHGRIAALQQGPQRIVFAFGPEYNQQIQNDTGTFYSRFFAVNGPKNSSQRRLTTGLLSMNGQQHKRNRRMVKQPFSKMAIESYRAGLESLADAMLDSWQVGQQRDIFQDMTHYMLRVTSTILFGFDQPELSYRLGQQIERWVVMNHQVGMGALVPNDVFSQGYEQLLAHAEKLEADIQEMIRRRRSDPKPGHDVLSILIRTHDEQGGLSDQELIGQAAILFAAAHLTTANTLTWTLFLLAQHPSVMHELWRELNDSDGRATPNMVHGEGATLMERVIKESMRVLPASSYLHRYNTVPIDLGPFHLPRGSTVIFSQYMTHHLPDIYPEPEHFRPDRWTHISPTPYEYLPFGSGPRMCIGGPMSMMNLKLTLPKILRRFRLKVVPRLTIHGKVISTMLTPSTPMSMQIFAADGNFESSPVFGNIHEMVRLVEVPRARRGKGDLQAA